MYIIDRIARAEQTYMFICKVAPQLGITIKTHSASCFPWLAALKELQMASDRKEHAAARTTVAGHFCSPCYESADLQNGWKTRCFSTADLSCCQSSCCASQNFGIALDSIRVWTGLKCPFAESKDIASFLGLGKGLVAVTTRRRKDRIWWSVCLSLSQSVLGAVAA